LERIESAEYGASDTASDKTDLTLLVSEASELLNRVSLFLERRSAQ